MTQPLTTQQIWLRVMEALIRRSKMAPELEDLHRMAERADDVVKLATKRFGEYT